MQKKKRKKIKNGFSNENNQRGLESRQKLSLYPILAAQVGILQTKRRKK